MEVRPSCISVGNELSMTSIHYRICTEATTDYVEIDYVLNMRVNNLVVLSSKLTFSIIKD